jgi:hypothetical protein
MPKKRSLKQQLADARREVQRLKEELAGQQNHLGARSFAEGKVRLLEAELTRERHKTQSLESAEAERTKQRPMSDAELMALAANVLTEHGPKTESQRRMTSELERRGVLTAPNPWADILRRWGPSLAPGALVASVVGHGLDGMAMSAESPPCTHTAKTP